MKRLNTVQDFIRGLSFIIIFVLFLPFFLVPLRRLLNGGSLLDLIAVGVGFSFNFWLARTVSGMFYILPQWQRLVLLRLGKFVGVKGPGFFIIPPFIYSVADIIDIRIRIQRVEATATLTKDNVPIKVTAAIEIEVEDPKKAVIDVQDYLSAVIWLSTEALKNTIGSLDLKELLSNREEIAHQLRRQIDQAAEDYGVNIRAVRITDIDTPPQLVEELAVIARARRAAQAKQIQAEAEVEVAQKMAEASRILAEQEGGFRLREIQNLAEMSKEESAMIIVYPYYSSAGENLAHAAVSLAQRKMSPGREGKKSFSSSSALSSSPPLPVTPKGES